MPLTDTAIKSLKGAPCPQHERAMLHSLSDVAFREFGALAGSLATRAKHVKALDPRRLYSQRRELSMAAPGRATNKGSP